MHGAAGGGGAARGGGSRGLAATWRARARRCQPRSFRRAAREKPPINREATSVDSSGTHALLAYVLSNQRVDRSRPGSSISHSRSPVDFYSSTTGA
ncbi:hypothetical protein GUJ93_ZPchr0002g24810 [Zizania palustris]|uniref:Uncharacterized protein n=1 Tax=Zizania palustris TaxID=103762 RepID=A0A8J5SFT9_ZIZPA|nr:hypothetical protein GUJ93_ZPchr0002g24810 [Zizania palustris]